MLNSKVRMTRQRKVIFEELKKMDSHPTADEIYNIVRQRLPHISLGTVYRDLEILHQYGEIEELLSTGKQKRFSGNTKTHYHVRCIHCGSVEDAAIEPFTTLEQALRGITDYEIIGHQLEFIGVCPKCRKRTSESDQPNPPFK